jgi:hypothetical protein
MPGINLNLPIPQLSDTQTVVITKVATALTAIQNDLTPNVTSSELNINAPLSFNGNPATNVGYVTMGGGSPSTAIPGTVYYTNGEWFLITGIGTIQLTNNGQINLSVNGGIGGDYGTAAALVAYDNAGTRYRFFGAGAVSLVDLDARKLVLEGTNATTTFATTALSNKTINILSVPTSGVGLLAYDASTNSLVDGATTPITSAPTFSGPLSFGAGITVIGAINGNISFPGNLTFSGVNSHTAVNTFSSVTSLNGGISHTDTWASEVPFLFDFPSTVAPAVNPVSVLTNGGSLTVVNTASATNNWTSIPFTSCGMREGDILRSMMFSLIKPSGTTLNIDLKKIVVGSAPTTIQTFSTTLTGGPTDFLCTVTSPVAIAAREKWFFTVRFSAVSEQVVSANIRWTR